MVVLKIILIASFIKVFLQDIKERQVYWFLFPIVALCAGVFLYKNMFTNLFYITISINLMFVLILIVVVFLYSKIKLKTTISNTFGLGDALLFSALAFTFSSISFVILFVFGLLFSLVLHLALKSKAKHKTVPLAGYLSLFFTIVYVTHWFGFLKMLYTI